MHTTSKNALLSLLLILGSVLLAAPCALASNNSEFDAVITKYGYSAIVDFIIAEQGWITIETDSGIEFVNRVRELKYVNRRTILADLGRIGVAPEELDKLLPEYAKRRKARQKELLSGASEPSQTPSRPYSSRIQWLTFRDNDLKFRFLYPADWIKDTPPDVDVRALIFAPKEYPLVYCYMMVGPFLESAGMSQEKISEEMTRAGPFSASSWKEMLAGKWSVRTVVDSRIVKLDNQAAYLGVVEGSSQILDRKYFVKLMSLNTVTPGLVWTFAGGAEGDTIEKCRVRFNHWQSTFWRILRSLIFEPW